MNKKFEAFKEKLDDFVRDYCSADGCRECHETGNSIVIDANDKQLMKFFKEIRDWR